MSLSKEYEKFFLAKKTVNKMRENIVKSTMKLYRQKSSPYKLVREKPVKSRTVEMSNSCSQNLVSMNDERTELLKKLMNLTEQVHRMREYLIITQMELYRRKSSSYKWTRDMSEKVPSSMKMEY